MNKRLSKNKIFVLLLAAFPLCAEKIDVIANFFPDEFSPREQMAEETGCEVRYFCLGFDLYLHSFYEPDVAKIFLMNDIASPANLSKIPREKLVLFIWEPGGVGAAYCNLFSRTYTYNDNLADGVNYFKAYYPVLRPMQEVLLPFECKKLCVMVSHTYTQERVKLIEFFENKGDGEFDFFGFSPMIKSRLYRGSIAGHPLSEEKLSVLNNYKFCICFENSFIRGYITEKIFACFAAGCVPIYLGAPNVEEYIPKECFIDYRDFESDEKLYQFIRAMPDRVYQGYIDRIGVYLQSDKAHLFSAEHFNSTLIDLLHNPPNVPVPLPEKSLPHDFLSQMMSTLPE